ncbi:MAG: N-acetylneuraminate synthase family protein [Candidatus Omnitrophica bacterium]|nr:N-acetylneuraminate synthase family protein [Candidatus Omnitrophota bacterium]MDD5352661.1 N-acetylneuraminate synthase family protein [Candidatus Omnitrophota bacterium]MDD5550260.1 N-acetylneuraminate synthase family protein [Candidatus Omnitrophota bacterium]
MKLIHVNNKIIGDEHPIYMIAEIGINHNGEVSLAKEMIAAAWEVGVDAVKIQTFITKEFLHPSHPDFQSNLHSEIPHEKEQEIWDFAKQKNINLFSTPEEFRSLEFIKKQNPHLIKIASMDFNYKELIQKAASLKKPIILSSGMSTMEEVIRAVRWVEEMGNNDYIVLHCTSCYPTPPQACNLLAIQTMKRALNCPVGYSDHSEGIHIPLVAAALGANVIEKHFTIDKSLPGPDQRCSIEPADLRMLIKNIRDLEKAIGDGKKAPRFEETEPRRYKRRGIYAAHDLKAGVVLKNEDVVFFAPSSEKSKVTNLSDMVGRKLKCDIAKMNLVTMDDLY